MPVNWLLSGFNFHFPTKESFAANARGAAHRPSPVMATRVTVINFIGTFPFLGFELKEAYPKPWNPVRMNHIEDCPFDTPDKT
jgi:hypothetical protein